MPAACLQGRHPARATFNASIGRFGMGTEHAKFKPVWRPLDGSVSGVPRGRQSMPRIEEHQQAQTVSGMPGAAALTSSCDLSLAGHFLDEVFSGGAARLQAAPHAQDICPRPRLGAVVGSHSGRLLQQLAAYGSHAARGLLHQRPQRAIGVQPRQGIAGCSQAGMGEGEGAEKGWGGQRAAAGGVEPVTARQASATQAWAPTAQTPSYRHPPPAHWARGWPGRTHMP